SRTTGSCDFPLLQNLYSAGSMETSRFEGWHALILDRFSVNASYAINKRLQPYRLSYQDVVSDRFQVDSYEPVPLELFKDTPFIIMKPGNDMYQRGFSMC
ncbi:hypothetical protein NE599_21555, partial [[Clostridium] symbiosum]|nr:hypothetical protein [[Clostridium] symbiosum]